mgnify:CR=1 FL=1
MLETLPKTKLPLYRNSIDWSWFDREFPAPDVYAETIFKWPTSRIRELQDQRFRKVVTAAWNNKFYRDLWSSKGIEPGDIRSLDDITRLPMFNSDDIKDSQRASPPYGDITGIDYRAEMQRNPLKIQSSGGTTGKPRPTMW